MPYILTIPRPMRVLNAWGDSGPLSLYPTGQYALQDQKHRLLDIVVGTSELEERLVFKLAMEEGARQEYLLVEEMGEAVNLCAREWALHNKQRSRAKGEALKRVELSMESACINLGQVLRSYIKPQFQVVSKETPEMPLSFGKNLTDLLLPARRRA